MVDFWIGDKVRIIGRIDEYIGKTGEIIKYGGKPDIRVGFRNLGEGIKGRKAGQHHWVILTDNINDTILLPENNVEKNE